MKLGIFSDLGRLTGGKYPGSYGQRILELDAQTFAEWDVDYVKMSAFSASPNKIENGKTNESIVSQMNLHCKGVPKFYSSVSEVRGFLRFDLKPSIHKINQRLLTQDFICKLYGTFEGVPFAYFGNSRSKISINFKSIFIVYVLVDLHGRSPDKYDSGID